MYKWASRLRELQYPCWAKSSQTRGKGSLNWYVDELLQLQQQVQQGSGSYGHVCGRVELNYMRYTQQATQATARNFGCILGLTLIFIIPMQRGLLDRITIFMCTKEDGSNDTRYSTDWCVIPVEHISVYTTVMMVVGWLWVFVIGRLYSVLYKGIFGAPDNGQTLYMWQGQMVESGLRCWAQHLIRIWGGRATTSSPHHPCIPT